MVSCSTWLLRSFIGAKVGTWGWDGSVFWDRLEFRLALPHKKGEFAVAQAADSNLIPPPSHRLVCYLFLLVMDVLVNDVRCHFESSMLWFTTRGKYSTMFYSSSASFFFLDLHSSLIIFNVEIKRKPESIWDTPYFFSSHFLKTYSNIILFGVIARMNIYMHEYLWFFVPAK